MHLHLPGRRAQPDRLCSIPKPKLNELHGQKMPESMTEKVRFAFIQKDTARLAGQPAEVHQARPMRHGAVRPVAAPGRAVADDIALVRSMHTDAFNHHPGQLMMCTGVPTFGRPSMGSWLNYGLGSESKNLPGYVVLTAGRGTSGGATTWGSGFLSSTYAGVLFRNQGEPVLNLTNPQRPERAICSSKTIEALRDLNTQRHQADRRSRRSTAASPPTSWRSACSRPPRS